MSRVEQTCMRWREMMIESRREYDAIRIAIAIVPRENIYAAFRAMYDDLAIIWLAVGLRPDINADFCMTEAAMRMLSRLPMVIVKMIAMFVPSLTDRIIGRHRRNVSVTMVLCYPWFYDRNEIQHYRVIGDMLAIQDTCRGIIAGL